MYSKLKLPFNSYCVISSPIIYGINFRPGICCFFFQIKISLNLAVLFTTQGDLTQYSCEIYGIQSVPVYVRTLLNIRRATRGQCLHWWNLNKNSRPRTQRLLMFLKLQSNHFNPCPHLLACSLSAVV